MLKSLLKNKFTSKLNALDISWVILIIITLLSAFFPLLYVIR